MVRASFAPGKQVTRWQKALENPAKALKQIGVHMLAASQRAFRDQAFGNDRWPERMVPNVPGIILDLKHEEDPQPHRFEERPALKDTGNLVRSLAMRVGDTYVEVGSTMLYAARAHHGGPGLSEPMTEKMQERLAKWLRTAAGAPWKEDLGYLLNRRQRGNPVLVRARARPFVGFHEQLRRDILEDLGLNIYEVSRGVS